MPTPAAARGPVAPGGAGWLAATAVATLLPFALAVALAPSLGGQPGPAYLPELVGARPEGPPAPR